MTPIQCKLGRTAIGWSVRGLASKAGVSPGAVSRFENGKDTYASTISKLEAAILATGKIRFEGKCVCLID